MELSLSGFLFEDGYKSQSLTFAEFCALAGSAGYKGVELRRTQATPQTPQADRKKMLAVATDHGLKITCLTTRGMPAEGTQREEFFQSYLDLCRDLDCHLMKTGGSCDWCNQAAEKAQRHGVALATNNHIGSKLETAEGTREFFRNVTHPNYGLLYDSNHLYIGGQDYLECIEEFVGRTKNILCQSSRPAGEGEEGNLEHNGRKWVTAAILDDPGVQDWPGILRRFKQFGYDGLITVIENGWPQERREYVARHCAEVLLRLWEQA